MLFRPFPAYIMVIIFAFAENPALAQSAAERSPLMQFADANGRPGGVKSPDDWQIKCGQIRDGLQQVMGPLPDRENLPPLDMQIRETVDEGTFVRHLITLTAAENEFVPAYLYLPKQKGETKKLPAMLALHGTGEYGKRIVDGDSPLANRAYARELAMRGYVVIAPDYPSFGELTDYDFKSDRYESGTMKGIFNHMRCVDLLQERDDVDPSRIGVIGHSLGGHNAMFVAAFDTRLQVIVSSCGWTELEYYDIGPAAVKTYGGRLGPFAQDRYMPLFRDRFQLDGDRIPFNFHEIIALFAPRSFFSSSPVHDANFDVAGVRKGIDLARAAYRLQDADERLQVVYPEAEHDFPPEVRLEAYRFIDKTLRHQPTCDDCLVR